MIIQHTKTFTLNDHVIHRKLMSDLVDCLTQHVIAFVTADLHRTQEPHVEVGVPVLVCKIYKCDTVTCLLFECQC